AELPAASVAVHCTVVMPIGKNEPEAGVQVTLVTAEQRSLAPGSGKFTMAPQRSRSLVRRRLSGQTICGAVRSRTITSALQELEAPLLSATVRVTRLVPSE